MEALHDLLDLRFLLSYILAVIIQMGQDCLKVYDSCQFIIWMLEIVWNVCDAENISEMDVSVYLGKDRQNATQMMVNSPTTRVEEVGHKFYIYKMWNHHSIIYNFFSFHSSNYGSCTFRCNIISMSAKWMLLNLRR